MGKSRLRERDLDPKRLGHSFQGIEFAYNRRNLSQSRSVYLFQMNRASR